MSSDEWDPRNPYKLVGNSHVIRLVKDEIKRVAQKPFTVLIIGETGVGKELVARNIHDESSRKDQPFVAVNCAAITPSLLESELFGYTSGAFTGADPKGKKGVFEAAHKGTIFLDEIGELSLLGQAAMLRVLGNDSVRRIGGSEEIHLDVKVIAASNRRLEDALKEKTMKPDTYYRLDRLRFFIPPLRDRKEDIPALFDYFLNKYCTETGMARMTVRADALGVLEGYCWPGNIRELENLAIRCVTHVEGGYITKDHIQEHSADARIAELPTSTIETVVAVPSGQRNGKDSRTDLPYGRDEFVQAGMKMGLLDYEYSLRLARIALDLCGGNKVQASKLLGWNRRTIHNTLKKGGTFAGEVILPIVDEKAVSDAYSAPRL